MQLISDLGHWVLDWADTPWGALALFVLAFWESSFFPLPPDGLMIALMVGNLPFTFGLFRPRHHRARSPAPCSATGSGDAAGGRF